MRRLANHVALEFSEGARDLGTAAAGGRGGVDVFLVEVEIDADGLVVLDRAQQIDERSPELVNAPGHHHVEPAPAGVLKHRVEVRPLITSLGVMATSVACQHYQPGEGLGENEDSCCSAVDPQPVAQCPERTGWTSRG